MDPAIPGGLPSSLSAAVPLAAVPQTAMWTEEENAAFEAALVEFNGVIGDEQCGGIAARIPGKAPVDVRDHYRRLVRDLEDIEAGIIKPPEYADDGRDGGGACRGPRRFPFGVSRAKPEDRKKGTPWTEDEHKRFLQGLEKYGKGDWRSISRHAVVTRTPTQVASHAQKYFLRQSMEGKKERRRTSIHDVTKP